MPLLLLNSKPFIRQRGLGISVVSVALSIKVAIKFVKVQSSRIQVCGLSIYFFFVRKVILEAGYL